MSLIFISLKKVYKISLKFLLALLVLLLVLWILLQTTFFQNWIIGRVTHTLSKNLNTTVTIQHVNFDLFNRMVLEKTLILDQEKDTLLYAGKVSVNITDWFFIKDKITLNYLGLSDAIIHLHRKTPEWNYQFLVDYFGDGNNDKKKSKPINLNLNVIHLEDVSIYQKDEWTGRDVLASVKDFRLKADNLSLADKSLMVQSITLEKPVFTQYDYEGLRPEKGPSPKNENEVSEPGNEAGWQVLIRDIKLSDGTVAIEREGDSPPERNVFSDRHIILSELEGRVKDLQLRQDTLTAGITLSCKDRGGFTIKKLQTDYKLSPGLMEFRNLSLNTAESHLSNYFAMHYQDFNDDMQDFIHAVKMEGHFVNSSLSSDDLAYFAPELKNWHTQFELAGKVTGAVDNLSLQDITIKEKGKSYLMGSGSLRGLPETDETFIDLRLKKMHTTYGELSKLIPSLREITQPNLAGFGNINFAGSFTGYFRDFVTFGTLQTDLGTLKMDLQMKLPEKRVPVYNGRISTENFDLGKFIENNQLGNVSFDGRINGKGFNKNNVQVGIDGAIHHIQFKGYNYQNILAHGNIQQQLFTGSASIHDPNIKIDTLVGSINFNKLNPAFDLEAEVLRLNLKNLGFTNDSISLTGNFHLNFTGNNIDDFLGTAKVTDAILMDEGQHLSFDSLKISSSLLKDTKLLTLQTNELEAIINGNFIIRELPQAFQLFLNKYYPAYINKPDKELENQNFTFLIKTKQVSPYVNLFDKRLRGLNDATIRGNINIEENLLHLEATVPEVQYANIVFDNIQLSGSSNQDTLMLTGDIADIIINDSLHSRSTELHLVVANDISDVNIHTSANENLNSANLSFTVKTRKDGFKLNLKPSSFIINQKEWTIQKNGEIELIDKMFMASNLRLFHNDQEILVSTVPSEIGNSNDIIISLNKLAIENLTPLFFKSPMIKGALSGNVRLNDPFDKTSVLFNTRIDQFSFEQDSIGTLLVKGSYHPKDHSLSAHLISDNELYNFKADFNYVPSNTASPLQGNVTFNHSGIHVLDYYLDDIVNNIRGKATGQLNIQGTLEHPQLVGKIQLDSTALTVTYTQCRYALENNTVIEFNPDEINFGSILIKDRNSQTATLSGKIYHKFFDDFYFNELHLQTNRTQRGPAKFLLLNTTEKDNDEFYGTVTGSAELSLNGFVTDMRMDISGEPTDSSHIFLPIDETAETGSLNYIDFIQFGQEMKVDSRVSKKTNLTLNMELTANPLATIDVIMDKTTNDVIRARGSGKLNISVGTKDPLTIRGRYNIAEGDYTFNFQTFLRTPFILQGGFIEWQGDPYQAHLNISAIYRAENVDLSNIPTSNGISHLRGDVNILFKLGGTLKNPIPKFEFQFPFDNPLKSDPIASEYIKTRYENDNNQLLNQVASLLLFNSFMTSDQGLLTGSNTGIFVTKSVGQLLSSTLSNSLNSWLQKLLKTHSINLYTNINTSDINFQGGVTQKEIQNVGNFGFRTSFLDGKLLVKLGGNVDYNYNSTVTNKNSNFLFTPDVSFEYLITPSGKLRVVGFNRSDADPGDIAGVTRRNRTGIQLSFRKDFDTFSEFFTGKKHQKEDKGKSKSIPSDKK